MRKVLLSCALALSCFVGFFVEVGFTEQPSKPVKKAVTLDDVLKLVQAGHDAPTILENCDTIFTLDAADRDKLIKAGATPSLVDALNKKRMLINDVVNYVLILDCSGSMSEKMPDGESKMSAAKRVLAELIQKIPAGKQVCFMIYGHDASLKCDAVKVIRALKELDSAGKLELQKVIATLKPVGHTPIALSLRTAGKELANAEGLSQIVLITDGMETCHGDPAKEAETLTQKLTLRSVEVIGLGITGEELDGVSKIARRGRGKFYDAQNAKALAEGLKQVVKLEPKPEPEPEVKEGEIPPAVAALIKVLFSPNADVRHGAAVSLGKLGQKAKGAAPALVKRVADDVWGSGPDAAINTDNATGNTSKDAALKALVKLDPDKAAEALLGAVKSKTTRVRHWATVQLAINYNGLEKAKAEGELPVGVKALVEALNDEDADVRHGAATSLGKLGPKAKGAVPALIKRVADDVWGSGPDAAINTDNATGNTSKDAALKTLRVLATKQQVTESLAKALESKNANVQEWATKKLAE